VGKRGGESVSAKMRDREGKRGGKEKQKERVCG
jgi:hypothetical protein